MKRPLILNHWRCKQSKCEIKSDAVAVLLWIGIGIAVVLAMIISIK